MTGPTIPSPAPDDVEPVVVIERGRAQEAVSDALNRVCEAVLHLEAVAMACARALDGDKRAT